VVDLVARTPLAGLVPLSVGSVTLSEVDPGHLTSVAHFRGREAALSEALRTAHGMAAPAPGRMSGREGARALWFGRQTFLLAGPVPDAGLAEHAALSDQTDGWAMARIEGRDAAAVLARLTPLDLRGDIFRRGHTARTDLAHMAASVSRLGTEAFLVMVFRGLAGTLAHEVRTAMEGVAARGPG